MLPMPRPWPHPPHDEGGHRRRRSPPPASNSLKVVLWSLWQNSLVESWGYANLVSQTLVVICDNLENVPNPCHGPPK